MRFYDVLPIGTIVLLVTLVQLLPPNSTVNVGATESVRAVPQSTSITIRFTGDVMLGRHVEVLLERHQAIPYFLTERLQLPGTPDYTVINFESAMTEPHRRTPSMTFQFATKSDNLRSLLPLQVTHASLANNHALDYGSAGYQLTKDQLAATNIATFGHPTAVTEEISVDYLEAGTETIALIGLHTLFRIIPESELKDLFSAVNAQSDYQIIYIHWGDEYVTTANNAQRQLAKSLVSLGADVIIGHHPHVVQDIEVIDGVVVFYSLGNFIFDQYFSPDVMDGLVVDLTISDGEEHFVLHPVTTRHARSQPELMSVDERLVFLTSLAARSDEALAVMIQNGTIQNKKLAIAP